MTSCAVVSMTFHGKYGYIRLLRYLASPYILYRLGKRVTQRTLVTLNVFLRKTAHLNPLHPPIRGISRLPVAVPAGRFICIALGFCVYLPVISADNIRYA